MTLSLREQVADGVGSAPTTLSSNILKSHSGSDGPTLAAESGNLPKECSEATRERSMPAADVDELPFVLEPQYIDKLRASTGLGQEALFISLMKPLMQLARPPISKFHVAAIGLGESGRAYVGVNLEFPGLPLHHSVHAEQFMVANANQHGETTLKSLVVSHAPCGHCRQFLQELRGAGDMRLVIVDKHAEARSLHEFLPHRFGPHDLLEENFPLLLEPRQNGLSFPSPSSLPLESPTSELEGQARGVAERSEHGKLAQAALESANTSYAPYSNSPSGIALLTSEGEVFCGSYMESAAYNPSLPPLQSALIWFVNC
eukprot:jgi/Mesen1/7897/ME000420S07050